MASEEPRHSLELEKPPVLEPDVDEIDRTGMPSDFDLVNDPHR